MASFHVWIAQGDKHASTCVDLPDLDQAKDHASKMWNEPRENIMGHNCVACTYECDPFLSAEEFY